MNEKLIEIMKDSDENLVVRLAKIGEKSGAQKQLSIINNCFDWTWKGGTPHVTLADQILREQKSKIERWGEKAYCLSEKQLAAIVRELRTRYDVAMQEA